jgi:hypothetical protein
MPSLPLPESDKYLAALRSQVCSHCIQRGPDCPPCAPHGKACGIEAHLPELVELCRTTNSAQMSEYIDNLHDRICSDCPDRETAACPCPLDYLLQLAVEAIESVDRQE